MPVYELQTQVNHTLGGCPPTAPKLETFEFVFEMQNEVATGMNSIAITIYRSTSNFGLLYLRSSMQ